MQYLTSLVTATLVCAGLAAPAPAQVVAYHDSTGADHQNSYNLLSVAGFRMITLSIYGAVNDPRYAAVWVNRPGPHVVAFHGLDSDDYQAFVDAHWPLGYRAKILSATGSSSDARFAGTMELTHADGWMSHGLTEADFWSQRSSAQQQGLDVTAIDIYSTGADPRYVVAFGPADYGQSEVVSVGVDGFQSHFSALGAGHARPSLVAFNDSHRYVSLWRSDDVGDWVAHHDMTASEYQDQFDAYWPARYPISVQGSGSGSTKRFAAVWAPSDLPATKTWTKTGHNFGQLAPFDTWVKNWMTDTDTRAATLAIVKDHRLVYARGYTLARAGYPITQPWSLFKIASNSKPITSIAMHQHFESGALDPSDAMLDYFPNITPLDSRLDQVTLHSLLTHQGGWNRNVSPDPMIAQDAVIASAYSESLPISKGLIRNYMLETQTLDFQPNSASRYSNFGFMLLGLVLQKANPGLTYGEVVERDIFQPLGLWRPQLARSLQSQLHPWEVIYHPYVPLLMNSVMDDEQPPVAGQYGGLNKENMDSHGGWVMSAPDFAKILAAFDLGASNPLMTPATAEEMWTVEPGYNRLMRGWYRSMVDDGSGGQVELYEHGGYLYGARSFVARRADGLSFVFLTNGDKRSLGGNEQGVELSNLANTISSWPNVDLFPDFSIPPFVRQPPHLEPFGHSCYGSWGFPRFDVLGDAEVGQEIEFRLRDVAPNHITLVSIGLNQINIPLGPIGGGNCSVQTDRIVTFVDIANGSGVSRIPWTLPANAAAIGTAVTTQGGILDPTANPLGLVTTHGWKITFGGWR